MDSNRYGRTLYLAYPCSVDAGIDPVLVINSVIRQTRQNSRYQDSEIRGKISRKIYKSLCHMCGCDESINPAELIKKARGMRTLWGYATAQDRTMMGEDAEKVEMYVRSKLLPAPEPQFIEHPFNIMGNRIGSRVISEVDNERISDLRGYLIDGQPGSVKFLYLSGHGLSPSIAYSLANCPADDETSKSAIWPWDLRRCMETMKKTPSEITREATTGDIVVFSSGLLTPEWVIDRIRDSESHGRRNTIIIVVDSCYSGMWRNRIITELQNSTKTKLKYARIILQTSCSHNEVSYGDLFTPLFCWLQYWGEEVMRNGVSAQQNSYLFQWQSPTFYDSNTQQSVNQTSVNVIKYQFGSKNFYFFNDSRIFHKAVALMCSYRDRTLVRGIPTNSIHKFFNSISANLPKKPKIISCKLKTIRNGTPMALFLVEWKNSFYHLHLHFKRFDNMVLSKITHVDVTKQSDIYRPQFTETGNKEYINSSHPVWVHIDCEQFANYCKEFMQKQNVNWKIRSSWNMTDSKPNGTIRSRCANLKIKLLTLSRT